MKPMLCILLCLLLFTGCQQEVQPEPTEVSQAEVPEPAEPPCALLFFGLEDYENFVRDMVLSEEEANEVLDKQNFRMNGLHDQKGAQELIQALESMLLLEIPGYLLQSIKIYPPPESGGVIFRYKSPDSRPITVSANYLTPSFEMEASAETVEVANDLFEVVCEGTRFRLGEPNAAFRYRVSIQGMAYTFMIYGDDEGEALEKLEGVQAIPFPKLQFQAGSFREAVQKPSAIRWDYDGETVTFLPETREYRNLYEQTIDRLPTERPWETVTYLETLALFSEK